MSAYISRTELSDLGLHSGSWGSIASTIVDSVISSSSGMVDSFLRASEDLPLTSVPFEVKMATAQLGAYHLMGIIGITNDAQSNLIRLRYEDMVGSPNQKGWLQKIASGEVSLSPTIDSTPNVNEAAPRYNNGNTESSSAQGWTV